MSNKEQPITGVVVDDNPSGLVTVDRDVAQALFLNQTALDKLLQAIRERAKQDASVDVSTKAARERIASLAYQVSRTKTYLDNHGKAVVDELKALPTRIDAGRRKVREALDALRDEIRRPVDEWEAKEAARIEAHKKALARIEAIPNQVIGARSESIQSAMDALLEQAIDGTWEEFAPMAALAKDQTLMRLRSMLTSALQAEEAERARQEREREEAQRREEEERARKAAEAAAAQAQHPTTMDIPAPTTVRAAMEPALQGFGTTIQPPQAVATIQQAHPLTAAEEDIEHRRKCNREALADLMAIMGGHEATAKAILMAIATGKVRHIAITY